RRDGRLDRPPEPRLGHRGAAAAACGLSRQPAHAAGCGAEPAVLPAGRRHRLRPAISSARPRAALHVMDESPILVEKRSGYRIITLNRPQRLNAFTEAMHQALRAALAEAEADPDCRALLLTGAGRGFCAGQDLNDRLSKAGETPVLGGALEAYYNPPVRKLRALPFPLVAAVNGVAAGAGCNIALACDIVIAARSASFIQSFAKIGLVPDSGGTWILPRLVGSARARALALTAEPLPAEKAE